MPAICLNLLEHSISDSVEHAYENLLFELREALVSKAGNRAHLHIKAVEVLEEALHPFDHDLVISPTELELYQEFLSVEALECRPDLCL